MTYSHRKVSSIQPLRRAAALVVTLSFATLGLVGLASAQNPVNLTYNVSADGPDFLYNFTLTDVTPPLSNIGFEWIIFGDSTTASPIADFTLTSAVVTSAGIFRSAADGTPSSPVSYVTASFGGHNGPTLGDVRTAWTPNAIGDTITWSGTSASKQTTLLWSILEVVDFNSPDPTPYGINYDWTSINFQQAVAPEPGAFAVLGIGVLGLVVRRRRRA